MKKTMTTLMLVCTLSFTYANTSFEFAKENAPITTIDLSKKSDLNSFCKAIMKGNTAIVKQLIDLGEDVNKKCLGKTPAMYAARYNKAEILELLIEHGANLRLKSDREKYTAKKFAELSNAQEALAIINATEEKR